MYLLYIETDDDFSVEFLGKIEFGHTVTLILRSVEDLDLVSVYGQKTYEFYTAIEAIKKNPDQYYNSTGGNRGVEWSKLNVQ